MISLPVVEASQVGAARRRAVQEAEEIALPVEGIERLALVVTEIATNLLRHGQDGEILIAACADGKGRGVTVVGIDSGPGIGNLEDALEDGFTTAAEGERGIGGGLGALRRLSDTFDIYSDGEGTAVVSTVTEGTTSTTVPLVLAGLIVPKPGFDSGGDAYAVRHLDEMTLVMLLDVLGHGSAAAEDARRAVAAFDAAGDTLLDAHRAMDEALSGRRGAASLIVAIPWEGSEVQAIGLGNVRGEIVVPGGQRRGIPCAPGIVGASAKDPRPTEHEWPPEATLVLSTDGLRGPERTSEPPALYMREPLTVAATLYKRRRRGSDDSGVVIARGPS